MSYISRGAWLGVYGTCRTCGASVSHYCCIASLLAKRPQAAGADWWIACDNAECANHQGVGVKKNCHPDWEISREKSKYAL